MLPLWQKRKLNDERVGFYGVDVYGWGDSATLLPDYLDMLEEGWGDEARRQLRALQRMGGDMARFRNAVIAGRPSTAEAVDGIIRKLEENRDDYRAQNPKACLKALQSAALLRQAKRHMRASAEGRQGSWNPRAENFMDTVERLLDHYGEEARGVLWAHNTHVGDGRQTPMGQAGMVNSGQLARERLGADNTYIVGFATGGGDVLAGRSWQAPRETMTMPEARDDSFEGWMRAAGLTRALILLEAAEKASVLREPGLQRAVGVVYRPAADHRQNYVPTVLPLRYNALLYFELTTPLTPLHR